MKVAAQKAAQEVGKEVIKKGMQEVAKKSTTEVAKESGKKLGKEIVHSTVDHIAEESDVPVLKGSTRLVSAVNKLGTNFRDTGRIGDSQKLRRNMIKNGAEQIADTQAHHVVPDEAFRKHAVGQKMIENHGTEIIDKAENGILLPNSPQSRLDPRLSNLPVHKGPHPKYTNNVLGQMDKMETALTNKYGSLDNVPKDVLDKQFAKLQNNLIKSMQNQEVLR